ncbi:EboA domain-containing protein [Mucilaginibacter antarcticus]|uniref:EboA domain-containing protein n=1 Tax=Mucilaginibacter antarcticus TaxID=1855725 RepID=A0ABW5XS28_9SPHI
MTALQSILKVIIRANTTNTVMDWLDETRPLNTAFAVTPRKTGKSIITVTEEQVHQLDTLAPGFTVEGWSIDRLIRVYLLVGADSRDKEAYFGVVENLFLAAEMGELVSLYSALPVLPYPELWVKRCAEGIRSNIGDVLEAIMYHNPYPAKHLEQAAWNQLVLKAFFTDKDINKIIGIDERANQDLAHIISDYAHERWAAGRETNPKQWRLVGPFLDDQFFADIKKLFEDGKLVDRKAAALAISQSNYQPAKALLDKYPELIAAIQNNELSWDTLTGQ